MAQEHGTDDKDGMVELLTDRWRDDHTSDRVLYGTTDDESMAIW